MGSLNTYVLKRSPDNGQLIEFHLKQFNSDNFLIQKTPDLKFNSPDNEKNNEMEVLREIVKLENASQNNFFVLCTESHQFTALYTHDYLLSCIKDAQEKNVDLLSGGAKTFEIGIQITEHLFWVEKFSGMSFLVIFRRLFETILSSELSHWNDLETLLNDLARQKFIIHPFLTLEKKCLNEDSQRIESCSQEKEFARASHDLNMFKQLKHFYSTNRKPVTDQSFNDIVIPTYVINLKERTDRLQHMRQQFELRPEFEVHVIEACKHPVGAFGLWQSMRKCVESAKVQDDDFIIICEDDHCFTSYYNRDFLLTNIIDAHAQNCDLLSGGIGHFRHAVPITENRFWISTFWSCQFMIVYKKFYDIFLSSPYDESVTADNKLSYMTMNKMVLYPFISIQKDFGYSDVTESNNNPGRIASLFENAGKKLRMYTEVGRKYSASQHSLR